MKPPAPVRIQLIFVLLLMIGKFGTSNLYYGYRAEIRLYRMRIIVFYTNSPHLI